MTLGERLKQLRLARGLSVRESASRIDKSPGYVSRIEVRGEIPSPELLVEIAKLYGADIEELLQLSKQAYLQRTEQEIDARHASVMALYRRQRK